MKIIYGRAGTGKSEYIFNSIKRESGKKTYIITPEQFSFTAEKRLIDTLDEGATTNVEVLSFERMAYKVIKETIPEIPQSIGKSGKAMIIFNAISKHQKELKFLGKSSENVEMIITQITEFKKHNITVEMLEKQVDSTENEYLKAKLNDMLIMYNELEEKIGDNFTDENDLLTLLSENIEKSHLFDHAIFYVDEFAGFTKQEYSVIEKIHDIADALYITVCTDDLRIKKSPEADIFYDNKQTVQSLCEICDLDKDKQIKLNNTYRFKNPELEHLEKNIYSIPYNIYEKDVENIELFLAENQYNEVEFVATEIIKLARDGKYRYKDIAVISNNIDQYSSLCKAIFEEYNIPVFIDEKKDLTQNIIIKYVLSILDIFSKSWSYDSVINYLKTGITDIENIYDIENYCLKWGIQGKKWYEKEWSYEDEKDGKDINFHAAQKEIVQPLLLFREKLNSKNTVKEISKELYEFIYANLVSKDAKKNSNNIKEDNNDTEKNSNDSIIDNPENVEAWNIIIDLLDEITEIFGDDKMSFTEYLKLINVGLSNKELGQIPQTQDKVIVGDVNRSKTHKVKAVFIIGANDGEFPSNVSSEGFLNDNDRANLKEQNFELAKGTREKMYEQNFNIYKALTTAEEKLFISYSASDSDGKPLRKALIISRLKKIFSKLQEKNEEKDEVLTERITFSKLLDNLENEDWIEVYKWYKNNYSIKLDNAMRALHYTNAPEKITNENIEKLYGNNLKTSISKMETYMACPFSYYLKYGLKISEKEKLEIKAIDTGSFMHNVVDEFFKRVKDDSKIENIKVLTDEQIEHLIDIIVEENMNYNSKFLTTAKYRTLLQRLKRVITISMKYIVESLRNSQFDVIGTEVSFGSNGNNKENKNTDDLNKNYLTDYPPIEIKLENGKIVSIEGKIDRIDIAKMPDGKYMRIIDYKSSTKDIDLNKVVAGLQLQLITYVDAVCTNENVMPAGALYFTLLEPKISISNRNITNEEIEKIIRQNYQMHGLVLADVNVIKAMDTRLTTGKSDTIPVTLNDSGEISYSKSNTVTREEFENLQKYANKIIKQISKEILGGNIELKPYYSAKDKRTPCSYCEYKSICQFNPKFKNNNYRYIPNEPKQEILDKINE